MLKYFTGKWTLGARQHKRQERVHSVKYVIRISQGNKMESRAHVASMARRNCYWKAGKPALSWHGFSSDYPLLIVSSKLASVLVWAPYSWEGAMISSPLTHIPDWQFPRGTAGVNLDLPWWRRVSSLAAAFTALYLRLTDGDKGSLKAILRQHRAEQYKWGFSKVPFPWKPSVTNTLLSSAQDAYSSHINAGLVQKFAQWMSVLKVHISKRS